MGIHQCPLHWEEYDRNVTWASTSQTFSDLCKPRLNSSHCLIMEQYSGRRRVIRHIFPAIHRLNNPTIIRSYSGTYLKTIGSLSLRRITKFGADIKSRILNSKLRKPKSQKPREDINRSGSFYAPGQSARWIVIFYFWMNLSDLAFYMGFWVCTNIFPIPIST